MIHVAYEPMEGVLVVAAGPCPMTGTYGEMIISDLHGAKIPPNGCCDPSQGQRDTRGLHQRKRSTFH